MRQNGGVNHAPEWRRGRTAPSPLMMEAFYTREPCPCILRDRRGCASVPKIDQNLDEIPRLQGPAQIMGALGPLTPRQSKALLDKIRADAGDAGMLQRHMPLKKPWRRAL